MRISNMELDCDFTVQCVKDSLVAVITFGLLKNGSVQKEKMVIQLLRKGKMDIIYDAATRKALAISLRDKGIKSSIEVEDYLYNEMLNRHAIFTA